MASNRPPPPRNGVCPHPTATLKDIPGEQGRFVCGLCGVAGTVMTKSAGGILQPKVWK